MKKIFASIILLTFGFVLVACGPKTVTITFESNGGSPVEDLVVTKGDVPIEPDTPTKDEYLFAGWFTTESFEEGTKFDWTVAIDKDIKLFAKWDLDDADFPTITFNTRGGVPATMDAIKVPQGTVVSPAPANPTRDGFDFIGWEISGKVGQFFDFKNPVDASMALNARWKERDAASYRAETYYTSIGSNTNMNPHSIVLADASTLYSLVSDTLYEGDYDFDAAYEQGIIDEPVVDQATLAEALKKAASIPFNYFPSMAAEKPIDVNGDGIVWEIPLKEGLTFFNNDGSKGDAITAQTFVDSFRLLLDPKLLNPRATNLYNTDSLPIEGAENYYYQERADQDKLGATIYKLGDNIYSQENASIGFVDPAEEGGKAGPEIFLASLQNARGELVNKLTHADTKAGVRTNTGVVSQASGKYFMVIVDKETEVETVLAPEAGWTLDGKALEVFDANNEDHEDATTLTAAIAYANQDGVALAKDLYVVTDEGVSVKDGVTLFEQAVTDFADVGIKAIDTHTLQITLTQKKSQWQVMTNLASAITSVVHVEKYEDGLIEGGTRTTYGTKENPLVSHGIYRLVEWEEESFYIFERNDNHRDAGDYAIKRIRYDIIADQSVIVNEYVNGRADVAGVSGEYFATYEKSEFLKLSPVSTIFRFAFGKDRGKDGDASNDNPIIGYEDFRYAVYFAVDRETYTTDVRKPGDPTHGFLGPVYFSGEENTVSYRESEPGKDVLAEFSPDTAGYDPARARTLFDQAYAQAVTDGKIEDGDVVSIELVLFNAESNMIMADWLKNQLENTFGNKFKLEIKAVSNEELDSAWDNGNFELTFGGWQGMQFWAPGMLQVYSNVMGADYILEAGFDTGNAPLEIELADGKAAVQGWLAELEEKPEAERTQADKNYIIDFTDFLDAFEGDTWNGTYDEAWSMVYYTVLDYESYDGRTDDFDRITAAMEGELMRQMIAVPLSTTVNAAIYSQRVQFLADEFHPRMGWGGLKYMSLSQAQ